MKFIKRGGGMPREPNPKIEQAKKLFRQGKKLIEIAEQLEVPEGTVRSWKNRYKWNVEDSATLQNDHLKKRNVAKGKSPPISNKKEKHLAEIEELDSSELTDKQKLFCIYYVKYFNASKAAMKAGYSKDYAYSRSYEMLENVGIKSEIEKLKKSKMGRAMLSNDDIFQKMIDIAFADITDYLEFGQEEVPVMTMYGPLVIKNEETGEEKEVTKWINTVKFKESTEIDGTIISEVKQGKDGASIKMYDKMRALEFLAKHIGLLDISTQTKLALEIQKAKGETSNNQLAEASKKMQDRINSHDES